ncbi:MAG: LPS assembly lipoprotein LptE [Archangium sp.]
MRGSFVLTLIFLSACGYRFVAPNSELPGGVRSVNVPVFMNRTPEPAAELTFTEAAKDQLSRAGRLGGNAAEAELVGTIAAVSSGPVMSAPSLPKQPVFRITATITLNLVKGGATIGTATITTSEEFPSGADVLLTESNRGAALKRLADTMIREGLERLQSPAP